MFVFAWEKSSPLLLSCAEKQERGKSVRRRAGGRRPDLLQNLIYLAQRFALRSDHELHSHMCAWCTGAYTFKLTLTTKVLSH